MPKLVMPPKQPDIVIACMCGLCPQCRRDTELLQAAIARIRQRQGEQVILDKLDRLHR